MQIHGTVLKVIKYSATSSPFILPPTLSLPTMLYAQHFLQGEGETQACNRSMVAFWLPCRGCLFCVPSPKYSLLVLSTEYGGLGLYNHSTLLHVRLTTSSMTKVGQLGQQPWAPTWREGKIAAATVATQRCQQNNTAGNHHCL